LTECKKKNKSNADGTTFDELKTKQASTGFILPGDAPLEVTISV
jgi:hypothetical protein